MVTPCTTMSCESCVKAFIVTSYQTGGGKFTGLKHTSQYNPAQLITSLQQIQ